MDAIKSWLLAGEPHHYWMALAGVYACGTFVLLKIPKVRANTPLEAIMNIINPYVLPVLRAVPVFGPVLASLLGVLDSPAPTKDGK